LHIGVCRLALYLPDSHSLKDKRQVARSLTSRLHNQFNVAVAEDQGDNLWQSLILVVCCVSNDASHANEVISRVVSFVEDSRRDLQLQDYETEIISGM
jgi:uncharacterized protein YlxP (DUF503 family)